MRRFHIPAVFVALVLGLATLGWWLGGMPFWIAVVMSAGAVWVNGLILTVEDDLPGGFNNPDGQSTPAYVGKLQFGVLGDRCAAVRGSGDRASQDPVAATVTRGGVPDCLRGARGALA